MRAPNRGERVQVPLMYVFRDAFDKRDAGSRDTRVEGGQTDPARRDDRRRDVSEAQLRQNFTVDLSALVDTIALEASEDLSSTQLVQRSILNYGLPDPTSVTISADAERLFGNKVRTALLNHEPRLRPETLVVEPSLEASEKAQRAFYRIRAEMICRPVDLPVEFMAEVDTESGKVVLSRSGRG